ncbi:lipase family protein [Serratia entomophila]|uniref:lipase family protein n=1 Tax=Serratia entomophila TaxID=42906 RepID=UPI00217AB316|nr:lipase family protein [Serratia entomophila]CAI1051630.1 Predicted lipase [Serratia entomophila]CAI1836835.1 Predicted lipase [Serratia entomophila]CAI2502919.1 Predicted lipase [Serratia entomophila]
MSESRTSAVGTFGKAQAPAQKKCWIEIQLVDENDTAVANMPWRAENEATRDKVIEPYSGVTDSEGILRIDNLLHPDLTLFIEAQPLADEMEQRPLSIERTNAYSMKMSPVTVDKKTKLICYYVVIGQLCDKAPQIPGWGDKELPTFHFPDREFSGLTISNMYFNARVIVKVCPFRAWNILLHHTKEYSIVNAMNLGLLANLSYTERSDVLSLFNKKFQSLSEVPLLVYCPIVIDVPFSERYIDPVFLDTTEGSNGEGGTQLFYLHNDKQIIVAWRGTEPSAGADIVTDAKFLPVPCPDIAPIGQCHRGFLEAFKLVQRLFPEDFERLNSLLAGRELFICGHSLGGALTLLQASMLINYNPLIYTYGMPRTFTKSAISSLGNITHYRHVNDTDTVTSIPMEVDVDNEMYKLWANMAVAFGFPKALADTVVSIKNKSQDPYWHHGNIVVFLKAEQAMVSFRKNKFEATSVDFGGNSPTINIKQISFKKAKLYLVPVLNENAFCESEDKHKKFIECLDPKSIDRYFKKNTNPDLDSLTNPANHSMENKYVPFLNNQLLELTDPSRELERRVKRKEFEEQVDKLMHSSDKVSMDEVVRNKLFLELQNLLPQALRVTQGIAVNENALIRFNDRAEEQYENIN